MRFRNPNMRHELAQIAWDGSQKLPFRILGTIRDALASGRPLGRLCVPIAAWMHFVRRAALRGQHVQDPLAPALFAVGRACDRSSTDIPGFLALESVFPPDVRTDVRFTHALAQAYERWTT